MLERIIENWLDKASEKSYQLPFCHMLINDEHNVLHLSRHCAMELGKDILSIDSNNIPHAFQLKGGNLSLSGWRELSGQLHDLVFGRIVFPSLGEITDYKAYLVTNGKIEEEAQRAIVDYNKNLESRGLPILHVYSRGDLLTKAKKLQTNLWPTELTDVKSLIEIFISDGKDILPKAKLASLLFKTLRLNEKEKVSKQESKRLISAAALLTSITTTNYLENDNHVAVVEAWVIYLAHILAFSEKNELSQSYFENEFEMGMKVIENTLKNLIEELKGRNHLLEGDVFFDKPFYNIRITWVSALVSVYGLYRKEDITERDFLKSFVLSNLSKMSLWGEGVIPQFLASYWFWKNCDATLNPDYWLASLIEGISKIHRNNIGLPNPYYEISELLPYSIDNELSEFLPHTFRMHEKAIRDSFVGSSYTLEGLTHIYVRRNFKQNMKLLWPNLTRIINREMRYEEPWHYYLWRNETGKEISVELKHTQEWAALRQQATDVVNLNMPNLIKKYPIFVLLFIIVYPHRANSSVLRWLDSEIRKIKS